MVARWSSSNDALCDRERLCASGEDCPGIEGSGEEMVKFMTSLLSPGISRMSWPEEGTRIFSNSPRENYTPLSIRSLFAWRWIPRTRRRVEQLRQRERHVATRVASRVALRYASMSGLVGAAPYHLAANLPALAEMREKLAYV